MAPSAAPPSAVIAPTLEPVWETPGPDAKVPEGQNVIPGLQLSDLARTLEDAGMSCVSWAGNSFTLHCERTIPEANAQVVAEAVYFTLDGDGVAYLNVGIVSIDDGPVKDSDSIAKEFFSRTAELVGGGKATSFLEDRYGNKDCRDACTQPLDGSVLSITVGVDGFQQLDVVAPPTEVH